MKCKDQGFAEKLLPVLLSTGMVFGLIVLSGRFTEMLRVREEMNQIARAYLLKMETTGYLNSNDMNQLEDKLKECGLSEISFLGTTLAEVDYGERISLVISGKLKTERKVVIPFVYKEKKDWSIPIQLHMVSTAKH